MSWWFWIALYWSFCFWLFLCWYKKMIDDGKKPKITIGEMSFMFFVSFLFPLFFFVSLIGRALSLNNEQDDDNK